MLTNSKKTHLRTTGGFFLDLPGFPNQEVHLGRVPDGAESGILRVAGRHVGHAKHDVGSSVSKKLARIIKSSLDVPLDLDVELLSQDLEQIDLCAAHWIFGPGIQKGEGWNAADHRLQRDG